MTQLSTAAWVTHNLALAAWFALAPAVIAITTVLAMRSSESGRWSTISRFLP